MHSRLERTPPAPDPDIALVTVYRSGDPSLMAVAKSVLDAVGIEYAVRGEMIQDLFGWGRFPTRTNLVVGPMEIQVREGDADEALALLAGLEPSDLNPATETIADDSEPAHRAGGES